jgi:hypothetical protein
LKPRDEASKEYTIEDRVKNLEYLYFAKIDHLQKPALDNFLNVDWFWIYALTMVGLTIWLYKDQRGE